jgi:hypothetical protein
VELVRLAARDRTDAAIAKPETLFVRVDELGGQFPGMPGAPSHGQNRLRARDRLRRLRASGERHPAHHEKIDEARDEVSRSTVALDHAAHNPAALQPWHLEADLRAGAGAADQAASAETSQPVYGKPKHGRHGVN